MNLHFLRRFHYHRTHLHSLVHIRYVFRHNWDPGNNTKLFFHVYLFFVVVQNLHKI